MYANSLNINKYFDNNGSVWAVQLLAHCGDIFCLTTTLFPLFSLLLQLRKVFWRIRSSCRHGGVLPDLRGPERCISRGHKEGVS